MRSEAFLDMEVGQDLSDRLKNEDITTVAFGGGFSLSGGGCCMSGEMFLVDQMTQALVNIKVSADQFVVD